MQEQAAGAPRAAESKTEKPVRVFKKTSDPKALPIFVTPLDEGGVEMTWTTSMGRDIRKFKTDAEFEKWINGHAKKQGVVEVNTDQRDRTLHQPEVIYRIQAREIAAWLRRSAHLFSSPHDPDFHYAFRLLFGFTWEQWRGEVDHYDGGAQPPTRWRVVEENERALSATIAAENARESMGAARVVELAVVAAELRKEFIHTEKPMSEFDAEFERRTGVSPEHWSTLKAS